jgi:hypothetical protein
MPCPFLAALRPRWQRDFFSEMAVVASGSIRSVTGTMMINNVSTQMIAPSITTYYDTSQAPPILSWIFGGVFNITQANSTITDIRFEGRDGGGGLVTALEVVTPQNSPIVIANPGLYAVLAVSTLQPQTTVTIST